MSDLRVGAPRASGGEGERGAGLPAPQGQEGGLGLTPQPGGVMLTEGFGPWTAVNTEGQMPRVAGGAPLAGARRELTGF